MKSGLFIFLSLWISVTAISQIDSTQVKIPIEGKRWYQLTNATWGLEGLFDNVTNVRVETGWGKIIPNYDAYYSLEDGEKMTIKSIRLFDWEGTLGDYPMTISVVTDNGTRIQIGKFTGDQYNTWVGPYPERQLADADKFKLDSPIANARFIVLNCWYQFPTEIEFYGSYTPPSKPVTPILRPPVKLKNMFGVNAFEWDFENPVDAFKIDESRMTVIKNFSGVRHYMDWEKPESHEASYTYCPVHSGGWNYDTMYQRCKTENIEVLACLKTIPGWMQDSYPSDQRDVENTPMRYGKDPADPWSYIEQAKLGFQYIARYGNNKNVDRSLLSVNTTPRWTADPINEIKTGLGVIKYIECDNERDKWWKGRKAYQTGFEYAANLSAFYDGNKNTMGAGVGVKNADSTVQVVMAGLALPATDYLRGMIDWCKINRGFKADGKPDLCWDVINYHYYSNNANVSQGGNPTRGTAPEISDADSIATEFLKVAHRYAYDMPVWITELGYDINQGSPYKAIAIAKKTVLQTQADWILRSALLYARSGAQRIFFYQLYDDNGASPGSFASMGLVNNNKTNRPAADFINQTNKLLGDYNYVETTNNDPIVDKYQYNGKLAYAILIPDEKGRTASYTLVITGYDSAKVCIPKAGALAMDIKYVKVTKGKLAVTATETPTFIFPYNAGGRPASRESFSSLSAEKIIKETSFVSAYPNPTNGKIEISVRNSISGNLYINILELSTARFLKKYQFSKTGDSFNGNIDIKELPQGVYALEILIGNEKVIKKVFKMN